MKRALVLFAAVATTAVMAGCDEAVLSSLPPSVASVVSTVDGFKADTSARLLTQDRLQDQDQLQLQLMDGSCGCDCDGDGSQHQHGGSNGSGGNGGG